MQCKRLAASLSSSLTTPCWHLQPLGGTECFAQPASEQSAACCCWTSSAHLNMYQTCQGHLARDKNHTAQASSKLSVLIHVGVCRLGRQCLSKDPRDRPTFEDVSRALKHMMSKLMRANSSDLANFRSLSCP